jgi:lysophospholipase L1-like esterase
MNFSMLGTCDRKPARWLVLATFFMLNLTTNSQAQATSSSVPNRIVCLGDSITDGNTYPEILMQAFHDAGAPVPACICSGVASDTSAMMDARFDKTVAVFKPEMVTVCEGTNDAGHDTSEESYEKSIRSIVAKAKAMGAKVMLLTPCACLARTGKTEAEKDASFAKTQAHLDSYEAVIRKVAADESCLLAENRKLFKEGLKEGENLFVEDNIHPNYLGQSLIARSILDALGRQDVALPKSFDPKVAPGLVEKWMLRLAPLDDKKQPVHLTSESIAKLVPDATWTPCELPEKEPLAPSAATWPEQMRRSGAVMKTESHIGKGQLGQGVATVTSTDGGQAFIQTGMGIATVWLNGVKVHDQMKVWTGAHLGKERIPVTLLKGENTIVIEFKDSFFLAVTPGMIWEDHIY